VISAIGYTEQRKTAGQQMPAGYGYGETDDD
jgi:hypothetical protein